jgi:hypothetical protein
MDIMLVFLLQAKNVSYVNTFSFSVASCMTVEYMSVCLWLYSPLDLGNFFNFLIVYTVYRMPWTGDEAATDT